MSGVGGWESSDWSDYAEVDPTGRYGRYNQILGKGASKIVYRAFDEYEGIEVAWNQVKLNDFLRKPEDLERLYSEIHLLKTIKHSNIMKFYASWVDSSNRNLNFVTEMFTSGTLRQYRLRHKKVNIRAIKHWCRQILKGLLYLHSLDPPVIHRDLKCDNIFINGNQGLVKIGDLGLAAILRKSHAAHCVGTPEFMAPEVYEEDYNELVDVYAFGMCVLEMVTFEYPYSECSHPAQIYKKVTSGKKPEALYKVKDPAVRQFVEKCLATVSNRLPARELLRDPFLQTDGEGYDLRPMDYQRDYYEEEEVVPLVREIPLLDMPEYYSSLLTGCSDYTGCELDYEVDDFETQGPETSEIDLFMSPDHEHEHEHEHEHSNLKSEISIKGKQRGDGDIFLRIRIADKEGRVRNIYFPFDIVNDTALCVATEMVAELDITDQDATKIADMIDGEIASLVPDWQKGFSFEKEEEEEEEEEEAAVATAPIEEATSGHGKHRKTASYLANYVSSENAIVNGLQVLHCSGHAPSHGRFEEITYQVEGAEQLLREDTKLMDSSEESGETHYTDICAHPVDSSGSFRQMSFKKSNRLIIETDEKNRREKIQNPLTPHNSPATGTIDPDENEIRKELRWLKAKYRMQLRGLRNQQFAAAKGEKQDLPPSIEKKNVTNIPGTRKKLSTYLDMDFNESWSSDSRSQKCGDVCSSSGEAYAPRLLAPAKTLFNESLLPHSLHRATSLPVDAVDC